MLTKLIASRFAGPILIALASLALAGGLFGGIQTYRLNNSQALTASLQETNGALGREVATLNGLIQGRDKLIEKQNDAIDRISNVRAEDRVIYLKQYAQADERAKDDDGRAAQLLSVQSSFTDELAECRASKLLLEEEVGQ